MSKYTDEQKQFIIDNVKGRTISELKELFNKTFNCDKSLRAIRKFKERHHLKSCANGKGTGGRQKGFRNYNYKDIGSERTTYCKNGYKRTLIKIADNRWEDKSRYLYKKYIGEIPKGYCVIFLDKNCDNFELDNLDLVSIKELATMSKYDLHFNDKELTKAGILVSKIITKSKKIKNEKI